MNFKISFTSIHKSKKKAIELNKPVINYLEENKSCTSFNIIQNNLVLLKLLICDIVIFNETIWKKKCTS